MHVSSASRMTSYSISCQPTRQRSTMTWPIGLARRPARTRSRYSASVPTMPPPVPPSVNAGRTIAGRPISARAQRRPTRSRSSGEAPSTIADGAYGWPIRSSRSRNRSRSSAISIASSGVPEEPDGWRSNTPARASATARLSAVWPPRPASRPSGRSRGDDRLDRLDRERLEVDDVGHGRVGHDRRRVRVDEDRPDALGPERAAGLRAGVVELRRLADDDRPGTEDEHGPRPGRVPSAVDRPAAHRAGRTAAATNRSNTASASSGPGRAFGVVLDGLDRQVAVAQALDRAVVEVDLADVEAAARRAGSRRRP